jgi:hypothetical protein
MVYYFIFILFLLFLFPIFESCKIFLKSQKGNEKWTFLKMSKNEKPKKVLKIGVFFSFDHNNHNYFFCKKIL